MSYNQLHLADPYTFPPQGNMTEDEAMAFARQEAKTWRNIELAKTDWIVPVTDHPERASYLTYRTALRNWPSTDDFPGTRPTL